MEPDRVEMSVGSGMVNGDHLVNGIATTNGTTINTKSQGSAPPPTNSTISNEGRYTNGGVVPVKKGTNGGAQDEGSILQDAPPELLQALSSEFYLPMARLVSRSAHSCWNDLLALVERLSSMSVPAPISSNGAAYVNDQSKVNLEKKDLLLNFAKVHKDIFIKLLVLLQWSRKSEEVRKTIELNLWLQQRRQAFNNATGMLGAMMRGLADSQVPNPDIYTASEVLATGDVSSMPKLDYIPRRTLTSKQVLRILRRLDTILCARMTLLTDLPLPLRIYHIHDGRVTFTIRDEFSFDVSVASEDPQAKFGMVDFKFLFFPAPSIPDGLHDEITRIANAALDKDGFAAVYDFLHDLTLSYMLTALAKQARNLSQGLWNGHLKVEVIRRTLVVQYWLKSSISKSWLEIGIHSGGKLAPPTTQYDTTNIPQLKLRWLREGKLVESDEVFIDLAHMSIEDVLRQVIAQHTSYLFDAIYDKLVSYPLYDQGQLDLEQSSSSQDPAECKLVVQLMKMDDLHVGMEPIGGSLVLSPVSERISRVQYDLTRSKNIVEDFVSRISSLRSSTAESNLIKSLPNSQWQRLEGIRVSLSEAQKLFGLAVSRISFIHLQEWAQEWMLAITQSTTGDLWWLIHTIQPNTLVGCQITEIVKNHPLYLFGHPSPKYLERLADYTTGVVALQCNADHLNKQKFMSRLPDIPAFDIESRLPTLQFSRISALGPLSSKSGLNQAVTRDTKIQLETNTTVHLRYHGIEQTSRKVVMFANTALAADTSVLRELASSKLDQSVAILPEKQQLMVRLESEAGTQVIETLMSKISHLENIVACAAAVRKSTQHTLQSLSLSSITILYHQKPDLSLRINFSQPTTDLSVSFLPPETNPQRQLSEWVVKLMKRQGQSSSHSLSSIFVVLRLTLPIMSYLHSLQSPPTTQESGSSATNRYLRVHVLQRQPTAYGLQYFANSSNFVRDDTKHDTPKRLLARFEVLAMKHGERLMWMVRPSLEEFNSYNRPSYTSRTLRDKLDQEIFKKQTQLWLALDGGAACPSEKPEQLLSAIHGAIVEWANDSIKPEAAGQQSSSTLSGPKASGSGEKQAAKPNQPPQKTQNMQQRPTSNPRPQQTTGHQRPQSSNNKNQGPRPSEVITLD